MLSAMVLASFVALPGGSGPQPSWFSLDAHLGFVASEPVTRRTPRPSQADCGLCAFGGALLGGLPGAALGVTALVRTDAWNVGGTLDLERVLTAALHAGTYLRLGDVGRLDLLAEAGVHAIGGVGTGDFNDTPQGATSALLPFVGVHPLLWFGTGGGVGFTFGLGFYARQDLWTKTFTLTGKAKDAPADKIEYAAGGATYGFELRLGFELR